MENFRGKVNRKNFNPDKHTVKDVGFYVEKLAEEFDDEMTKFFDSLKADFQKTIEERAVGIQSDYSITVPKILVRKALRKL